MLHEGKAGLDVVRGHAFGGIEFGKHNLPHAPGLQMAVCDREYLRVGLAVRALENAVERVQLVVTGAGFIGQQIERE